MKKPKFNILTLMILACTGLMFLSLEKALKALSHTGSNMLQLIMVMPIILAMTALTKAWVPEDLISGKLGKTSGFKGSLLALVLGSVSAGPIYAAFPFAKALLDKGASLRNITILLSSWAVIKVPMLANEVAFLGPRFMVTRWLLTVVSILILSKILEKTVSVKDIPTPTLGMDKVVFSQALQVTERCTGCSLCKKVLPQAYSNLIVIENRRAHLTPGIEVSQTLAKQLVASCSRKALTF
tara:strand:- start:1991 stop:2710 length:720 start_codon:yes stop_codon:yes gene_type:complete